ncbi:hypothetical protein BH11BAC5_BH11BAC5_34000 [soil metagenome]
MQSVQQTIIKLNNNFQKLHFENNLIFFSEILPEKIFEIKNFFILVHEKFPLPYGIEDLIRKTNLEQECINEQFIGNDLSYWQKDGHLNTCKIKIAECLYKFYHDFYYPGILKKMI